MSLKEKYTSRKKYSRILIPLGSLFYLVALVAFLFLPKTPCEHFSCGFNIIFTNRKYIHINKIF